MKIGLGANRAGPWCKKQADVGPPWSVISTLTVLNNLCLNDLDLWYFQKQGEEQVSAQHESAFATAYVAINIMKLVPQVTELILAHFYLKCPYILPYYLPKKEGQSDEDYYK